MNRNLAARPIAEEQTNRANERRKQAARKQGRKEGICYSSTSNLGAVLNMAFK